MRETSTPRETWPVVTGALPRKMVRGHPAAGLGGAQAGLLVLEGGGLGPLAVDVPLQHGVPALGQVVDQLVAGVPVVQRQAARRDHQVVVAVLPQPVDQSGHQLQHAAGPLEVLQAGPVFIQAVEEFGVDGVGRHQAVEVGRLLGDPGQVVGPQKVGVGEGPAHLAGGPLVGDRAEQSPAHDLEGLLTGHGFPQGLDPPEVVG